MPTSGPPGTTVHRVSTAHSGTTVQSTTHSDTGIQRISTAHSGTTKYESLHLSYYPPLKSFKSLKLPDLQDASEGADGVVLKPPQASIPSYS